MKTIVSGSDLALLAACATPSTPPPAPAPAAASARLDAARESITLSEFVRRCQRESGLNITYDQPTEAMLGARTIVWAGPAEAEAGEFDRLFYAVLSAAGFECRSVGPRELGVIQIRAPQ